MGRLKELLDEYKKAPIDSSKERELKSEINKIVSWMEENNILEKPFKLPRKRRKYLSYGIVPDYNIGNFLFFDFDFCKSCRLLLNSPLMLGDGRIPFAKK